MMGRLSCVLPQLGGETESLRRGEAHHPLIAGVLHLDEGDAARRYADSPALGVGEPAKPSFRNGALHLFPELVRIVYFDLEQLVGRAYSNANLHAAIVTPFQSLGAGHTFDP